MNHAIGGVGEIVLQTLTDEQGMTFAHLCRESGLAAVQLDNAVAALVRHGFVRRIHSDDAVLRYVRLNHEQQPSCAGVRYGPLRALILPMLKRHGLLCLDEIHGRVSNNYARSTISKCLSVMHAAGEVHFIRDGRTLRWELLH